ncbi:chemotaxis protein CheA [soil metagenome]
MEPSRYTELFLSESRALISLINHHLLELERSGGTGTVEELFRAAHTLKGMSAAMECHVAADLAHFMENLLNHLGGAESEIGETVLELLFEAADALEQTIAAEAVGAAAPGSVAPLLERLRRVTERTPTAAQDASAEIAPTAVAAGTGTRVTVMIQTSAALPAVRAMLVLRAARELGTVSAVEPSEEELTAGRFSGSLQFLLHGEQDPELIRTLVLRAGEVSHVAVELIGPPAAEHRQATAADYESVRVLDAYVRVSQQLMDTMITRIGELVIARDRLKGLVAGNASSGLDEASEQISRLIGEMRDDIIRMRMAPIGDAFDRFPRFMRDAARSLSKDVAFEITGKDTPLDRSLHNDLAGVLIHLLRNALDHGIENPEDRVSRGKPRSGTIQLSAAAERSHVVVRVRDDGAGIDLDRVAASAVEAGMLTPQQAGAAGQEELLQLLTRSGFTTRHEVTDVSGRGVGLDVVASRVHAAGGLLEIETERGEGTCFSLRFPLSLSIFRTLQVEASGTIYMVPISSIEEVADLGAAAAAGWSTGEREASMSFRDQTIPVICLGALLNGVEGACPHPLSPVVIAHGNDGLFGLLVDHLHGQHEAVLKPFGLMRGMKDVFSGATILPDGRPSLVVDSLKLGTFLTHAGGADSASAVLAPS